MTDNNLAPWIRLPEPERLALSDYCALAQLVSVSTSAQIERTGSIDDPIASAVIESLRFELENAQQMVMHLQQELQKVRGDSDDE
jgi:hypothetical protein